MTRARPDAARAATRTRRLAPWCAAVTLAAAAPAMAQAPAAPSRGQLLYDTHCVECHNTQVHWRDGRLVTDWASLKAQVRRWQGRALLDWSEADIVAVARYLNESIYRHAQTDGLLGLLRPRRTGGAAGAADASVNSVTDSKPPL